MKKSFNDVKDIYIQFFEENGTEFTEENGENIPLDDKCHDTGIEERWSKDIIALSKNGLVRGYYRGADKQFTLSGFAINDLYLEDCKDSLLINKFIHTDQLNDLSKHLKTN